MKLERVADRVWIYPFEEERDRPNLGYIRGDHWSLAVDAGHSRGHIEAFYKALEAEGLRLPALTALTHWHWDHTFAMYAAHGPCVGNARTDAYLRDFRARLAQEGPAFFFALHETIRREYAPDDPVVVTTPDVVFKGELRLDAGNCPIRLFQAESPHTDDATLIEAPGALFLGDAAGGVFPTWEKDPALCLKLAATVASSGAPVCVTGHGTPAPRDDVVRDLIEDAGI